jgi:hypothetical protein
VFRAFAVLLMTDFRGFTTSSHTTTQHHHHLFQITKKLHREISTSRTTSSRCCHSLQVKARMWWTSRAGGGEDFAVLRSRGLHLPGQCKYTLQHANSHNSIAEMVGIAATVVGVGAASVYAMVRLDGGSSDSAPPAAETATKSSTTSVRLHTVGDYLVSTITHPHSCINMPWRRHN